MNEDWLAVLVAFVIIALVYLGIQLGTLGGVPW